MVPLGPSSPVLRQGPPFLIPRGHPAQSGRRSLLRPLRSNRGLLRSLLPSPSFRNAWVQPGPLYRELVPDRALRIHLSPFLLLVALPVRVERWRRTRPCIGNSSLGTYELCEGVLWKCNKVVPVRSSASSYVAPAASSRTGRFLPHLLLRRALEAVSGDSAPAVLASRHMRTCLLPLPRRLRLCDEGLDHVPCLVVMVLHRRRLHEVSTWG